MPTKIHAASLAAAFAGIVGLGLPALAKDATVTGKIGDSMCSVTHMVKGDDAACTRACVKGGSEYALIVKDKAYTLEASPKLKAQLDRLADRTVTVTGSQSGGTIQVTSVRAAR